VLGFKQVKKKTHTHTQTQRKVYIGKEKSSILSLADTRQSASFPFPSSSLYLSSRINLLWNPNQITPTAFQPILVTFVWGFLPHRKGLVYILFCFCFKFSLIYFVRSYYKTVKKDFSFCKMIFFI
jgi:hypothetical protein